MHTALWLSCMELDAGRPEGAKFRLAIRKIQKTPLQKAVQHWSDLGVGFRHARSRERPKYFREREYLTSIFYLRTVKFVSLSIWLMFLQLT